MAITAGRAEFTFAAEGADETAAAFRKVAAAEDAEAKAADGAAKELADLDTAQTKVSASAKATATSVTTAASSAAAAEKSASGLSKAAKAAGDGFALLARAANILPGLGIAGLLLGIFEGAKSVIEGMTGASGATTGAGDALSYYARQAMAAQSATASLIAEMDKAAQSDYLKALGGAGASGIGSQAMAASRERTALQDEIRRLSEMRTEMERNPAGTFLRPDAQAEADRLLQQSAEISRVAEGRRTFWNTAPGYENADRRTEEERAIARDLELRAAHIMDSQRLTAEGIDDLVGAAQNRIADLDKSMKSLTGTADRTVAAVARTGGKPSAPGVPDWQIASRQRHEMMGAHAIGESLPQPLPPGFMPPTQPQVPGSALGPPSVFASLVGTDADREKWQADVETASAGMRGLYEQSARAADGVLDLGASMAKGLAQAAAAAILTGGSFKHMANAVLKSAAVEAGTLAIMETAKGVGTLALNALFPNPNAIASATLHFQSAAQFAGVTAVAAAGAAATGGLRSGGGGGGGGGGAGASAAGTNPYQGTGGGETHVTVVIGTEVVTRGVHSEVRKRELRGGVTEPRLAMAGG